MTNNIQDLLAKLTLEQLNQLESQLGKVATRKTINVTLHFHCQSCKTKFTEERNVYADTYVNLGTYSVRSCKYCIEQFITLYTKEQLAQTIYNLLTYSHL